MPSVIVVDPDGREYSVMTAEALVWAVYGRGAELKTGTYQENLEILQGGDPPAPNTLRHVTLADLADFFSPAATSIRAGLENATAVNPSGSWDFAQAPTVNGQAMAGGSAPVQSVNGETGAVVLDAGDVGAATTVHTHTAENISDSTATGRSVLTAADAAAARTAIGAGTGSSNLAIGTTSTTAKAGDYQPTAANISDSTATGRSVLTAASSAAARTAIGAGTSSLAIGTTGTTAAAGNDSRLSDARTPTAHNHPIADLTATGTRDATTFLRGDGTWSTTPAAQGAPDATTTTKGVVQLAGDLGGTAAAPTVPGLAGKAATTHTHTATNISDSTATGRSVLTAADAAAARTAIGAGTSNLAIGTTGTTAKAGDYTPPIDQVAGTASMRTLGTGATQAAAGNDSRLSDARTPTAHTHTASQVSDSTTVGRAVLTAVDAPAARTAIGAGTSNLAIGTTGTTAAAGNDSRLSDARTPTAHTHVATTDLTATGTKDATTFLRGDNTWAVPAGGGGGWTAVDASETVKGIVELATTAEATTGTDTVRAVTPAGVKAVADTKAATSHTHTATNISDSTATGRSVLTAVDAAAARTAIGAGTSSLAIGTTGTTAAAGNDSRLSDARTPTAHTHTASQVSDSTTVGRAVLTAADAAAARTATGAGRVDSSDGTVLNIVKITAAAHAALVSAGTTVATTQYNIVG